jgi:membrane protein
MNLIKKIGSVILFAALPVISFSDCQTDLNTSRTNTQNLLNAGSRPYAQEAYNTIVQNYLVGSTGNGVATCENELRASEAVRNKLADVQNRLNSQINNNFNGKNQIPYNANQEYNGQKARDANGNMVLNEDKETIEKGTDQLGLVKFMYGASGVKTAAMNSLTSDNLAKMTKYQLQPNSPLKPGDVVVMNYKNDGSIDSFGVVYYDNSAGRLKMLEMGGSSQSGGSSVKSEIPVTGAGGTAYVVPFETLMQNAYTPQENENEHYQDIKNSIETAPGTTLQIPSGNPNVTEYSQPRPAGVLQDNGFSQSTKDSGAVSTADMSASIRGMAGDLFSMLNKGMVYLSRAILATMIALLILQVTWTFVTGGIAGSLDEIVSAVLTKIIAASPYLVFVSLYPVLMKNIGIPLFFNKIPGFLLGDFFREAGIGAGEKATYMDLAIFCITKSTPLIIATFGAGLAQGDSVGGLFKMFATIWKTFVGWMDIQTPADIAMNALHTIGTIYGISRTVLQLFFFRPLTSMMGLMTLVTMLNLVLNIFMTGINFIISISLGLFYMICGTIDILQGKALNTLNIAVDGLIKYLIQMTFVLVMSMALGFLGTRAIGAIINPLNMINMVQVYLCVSIVQNMTKQIGRSIATSI